MGHGDAEPTREDTKERICPQEENEGVCSSTTEVRLHGLKQDLYNHHIGTVNAADEGTVEGRVAVSLHSGFKNILVRTQNVEPLLARSTGCREYSIHCVAEKIVVRVLQKYLHQSELVNRVLDFLRVNVVKMKEVKAVACSSNHGNGTSQSMHGTLMREEGTWWISAPGTALQGVANEWVEYSLGPAPRRVDRVSLRIPEMPSGPLSVRKFHLEVPNPTGSPGDYIPVTTTLVTLDTDKMQSFALLPPVEAQSLRIVCTENAAGSQYEGFNCIGFLDISFS